jgi:hypothetical protein
MLQCGRIDRRWTLSSIPKPASRTRLPKPRGCARSRTTSSGNDDKGREIITDNRVLFHRVPNTLNYLDIRTVLVSCGTCMDQLQKYEFEKIFPGCRLLNIHEYLLEKGVRLGEGELSGVRYMYHDPCHTPIKSYQPDADYIVVEIARRVLGPDWLPDYVKAANNGGIERVLV